ncbi:hypothetical protein LAZ67_1007352, partial [Cordylochernes scorpioides]
MVRRLTYTQRRSTGHFLVFGVPEGPGLHCDTRKYNIHTKTTTPCSTRGYHSKGFEDFFGGVIHQVLAESKLRGTLPESSRRNIICLVPKAHGGSGLSGYRPISLPTADYRIVSSVLLGRLRRHLPAIVPDCQTYAVPGRCPSWNIACVSDEVAQAFKNKTPLAVISTDLQSAFDNVDREFLASQLRIIGLPPPFMEWLHLLYAEADATIKVDGNFTRPFKMRRGLRQGCACSAALFSIFTGPLLRHLERILGRGNVLAYADDILLLIREDWQFERVKTVFDEFRRASGVSVNFPKSKGLWCGAWRDRADSPLGISWSASSITVLGCEITSGHGTSVQENHLLGILERSISRWSPFVRGFSLVGRARAANSLVLAAVLHHLHGYLPGDATIAKLQARLTRFVWGSCHRAAWLPGGLLARPVSVGGVGLLDIRTQLQLACFKGVQAASRNGGKNAYSWLVESGAWMTPLSSGSWLLPRRRRLLDLWGQASSILGLNHRVLPAPTLLNLPLVGACRFLATPSLRAPSRWRGVRVRDLAGPAPPPIARLTRSACEDAAALGAFCQRLVADNATSIYRERTLEEAVVLRGTATPFLRISTRTARRMLERPRLAAVPISRYLRRWAPVVDVPSTSLASSSLRRCSFGGHAADIALRLALHALPHPGHPASSQPVCIACGSSDLSLAHRYWSCSAVRPLIREVFSIIGRPPDLQSWIFAVNLENHAITISSAAKHAIYVFFVDREMRGISGDPLAIFHQTLQRWQRRHVHSLLADSQYDGEQNGAIPFGVTTTNAEISAENNSVKNVSISETNEKYAKSPVTSGGYANSPQSSRNWADIVENDEIFEQPKKRKRLLPSESASQSLPGPSRQTKTTRDSTTPRQPSCPRNTIEQIKVSRQMLAQCRSKAAAGTYDQMTYLEFSPEFTQVDYIKALENKLGKGCVVQIGKASGQILVGFERPDMAETIIEDGLMIKGALLKALPYQKKAEKITISGLPFVIEDADIIRTLRPYCQHAVDIAFIQETNVTTLDSVEDLCLGYRAAVVPTSGARGSGLACIFSSGVQVIGQQVLSPGKIAAFDVTIRGSKATFVNCHLSHAPDERLQQLQVIAAAAVNEDAWVLGDLNISEESASDIASGSVEALGELLDRANLVDAAAIFDATHLPTRISSCGSRVDARRLDRVLIPSSFSNRVTRYWSLYYKNSDHRAVLLQTGEASEPRPPCIASMLRSRLVVGTVETLLDEALGNIEDMRNAEIWRRWGHIKAHLASAIKSLHDLRNNDDDYISRARKYVQAKLEDVSIYSDYPSLPDLGRALRLRRRGTSSNTFYDSAGRMITGPAVRELAFVNLKERFSHPSCSPEDIDGFLRGFTLRVTIEESDPLHRYGIGEEEIVAAIGRLPTGKAAGWDDLPCELFRGFEVLLLYAGAEAAARIEGIGRTPLFHMLNGVRQGCAASAAFFTISTGPLLLRLEQLLGRDNVLAYADDIVLLIREDGQLEVVRKIFEDFRRASGIRVNFGKSQGLWCGRWRNRTDSPSAISWNREKINILGTLVTPGMGTSAQDQHLQELLERAIARWSPFVRGLSLAGRAKAANSLVLSAIYYHLQAYLPSETTIGRLQARLARFVWGHDRTSWLPSSILARPISVGGMGLLDVGTQLRLSCLKGVQAALRGGRNAHSWLAESGMWLTPASTPGIWLPPRRRRSLHLFESAAEILDLNHRILQPALLRALRVVGDCRFLRPPELLAPTRWLGWRIGELTGPAPNITIATRGALTDVAALGSFCTRLITQNARGRYRVDSLADAIVVRGTTTAFQRLTTRTARRLLERPRLAALPITQLFGRWFPHVSIPISINWSSLRRCAFSGHNADVAVRLALHALPHPAHPASARESCIACGSGDLSLAHRYWSCSRIRPVILEAFTILQRPPDLQSWIFGHDLEDDALAIMASAKTRIYKHFLGLEMRGVQEDPLLVWRRTLSSEAKSIDKAVSVMATEDSVEHRCSFLKGVCSVEGVKEINSIKGEMKMLSASVNRMKHENEQCIEDLKGEIEKLTKLLGEIKLSPPECKLGHIASDCSRQSSMFANRYTLDNAEIVNIRSYGRDQFGNLPIVKESWDDALKTLRIVSVTDHEQTLTRVKTCRVGNENGRELGEIRFWLMSLGEKAYDGILGINDIRRLNIQLPPVRERGNMISLEPEDHDYVDLSCVASAHGPMVSSAIDEKSVRRIENEAVKLPPTEFNRNCECSAGSVNSFRKPTWAERLRAMRKAKETVRQFMSGNSAKKLMNPRPPYTKGFDIGDLVMLAVPKTEGYSNVYGPFRMEARVSDVKFR